MHALFISFKKRKGRIRPLLHGSSVLFCARAVAVVDPCGTRQRPPSGWLAGAATGGLGLFSGCLRQGCLRCVANLCCAVAVRLGRVSFWFGLLRGRRRLGRICVYVVALLLAVWLITCVGKSAAGWSALFCPAAPLRVPDVYPLAGHAQPTFTVSTFLLVTTLSISRCARTTSAGSVGVLLKVLLPPRVMCPRWASRANGLVFLR